MRYINAKDVLPKELLIEIQKYTDEGLLYIPAMIQRKEWGSVSGSKFKIANRNRIIKKEYDLGKTVKEIEKEYFLSKSTIYRILKTCDE